MNKLIFLKKKGYKFDFLLSKFSNKKVSSFNRLFASLLLCCGNVDMFNHKGSLRKVFVRDD